MLDLTIKDREDWFARLISIAVFVIGVVAAVFYLYSAEFGLFSTMLQRGVLLSSAIFISYMLRARTSRTWSAYWGIHVGLGCAGAAIAMYFAVEHDAIALRPTGPTGFETVIGTCLGLLVLDFARREVGWIMALIAVVFISHAYFGPYLPGFLYHRGLDANYLAQYLSFETEGIWGISLGVAATIIVVFIIFGSALKATGAGEFLVDLSYAAFGRFRGGPAKMAVIGSGLFGTVSGSTVANVMGTGTFTIPLMKKVGYRPEFAGAVEATASCGGQLMPPVMGAAAFIMAQILGVSYADVMVAAVLPAILYYLAVFFAVDLEAARIGLKGLPLDRIPSVSALLRERGILLAPLIVLIALLTVLQWSPMKAAFWATIVALGVGIIVPPPGGDRNPLRMIAALGEAIVEMVPITAAVACAGLIIGALTMTGVTLKLSTMLIDWSHGSMLVLLVLTMLASIVLGMGLPTVACYILLAILLAPALVTMGADPMAAHLFVFYFGIVSGITPPVAMAAFAAAAISGANQNKTGFTAVRIGLSAFILPYMFVFAPALLLKGSLAAIVLAASTASIGIWALTASVIGYGFGTLAVWQRVGLFIASVALIFPGLASDLFGMTILAALIGRQFFTRRLMTGDYPSERSKP